MNQLAVPVALTPRERQVLACIVAGRSNKEIGAELAIAQGTVKAHIEHLMDKLEVRSRAALTARAVREGLAE